MNSRRPSPTKWIRTKLRTARKLSRGDITPASVVRNKWQKFKRLASLNKIEEVPLSLLLIGQQCGIPLGQWVKNTKEYSRVSQLLGDSPYVEFLREVDRDRSILQDSGRMKKTAYYAMARVCMQYTGNFMGKKGESAIIDWMREYYAFYSSLQTGTSYRSDVFLDDGHSGAEEPVQVSKVRDSEYYEIIDGHHRCAIAFMCGKTTIAAEIAGTAYSYLQGLIIKSTGSPGRAMMQPVDAPELKHWPVRKDFRNIFAQKLRFLRENSLPVTGDTCLDIPCGYGYFLKLFKQHGLSVFGVDPDDNVLQIARSIHGITEEECYRQNTFDFLGNTDKFFTVVSLNSPLDPSAEATPDILKNLSRITDRVLFIQCETSGIDARNDSQELIGNLIAEHAAFGKTIFLEHGIIACVRYERNKARLSFQN